MKGIEVCAQGVRVYVSEPRRGTDWLGVNLVEVRKCEQKVGLRVLGHWERALSVVPRGR